MRTGVWSWTAFAMLMAGSLGEVRAADVFRMETEVFVGGESKAAAEYLTLFTESAIYDFKVTSPEETTLFDLQRNRIVVLDPYEKRKAAVSTDEILQFTAKMKAVVDESNPVFFAAAHPQHQSILDGDGQWLTLSSKHLIYRVRGAKPKFPSATRRYQEFADWSARLSAMRLGNLPPFARIELNRAAAEKDWIPEEVERVVNPAKLGQKKQEVRTMHYVNWTLSESDRKKIEKVGNQLAQFPSVEFQEFREPGKVAQRDKR